MANTYFYINDQEREELFNYLKTLGVNLIPDKKYSSPNFEIVGSSKEFIDRIRNETVRFFAISNHFSIYSLYLERNKYVQKEDAYFVKQKYGGPYFDIALYRGFADETPIKYKCIWLSHLPRFIKLQEEYEEFKVTEELKEYFKKTIKFLQSKCQRVKINGKQYWVSKEVCKELGFS
jgi:hypothetical protein